jgi:hypothetical protein
VDGEEGLNLQDEAIAPLRNTHRIRNS